MLKHLAPALLVVATTPGYCLAQSEDSAGMVIQTGEARQMLQNMMADTAARKHVEDNCWKLGCLVIINETQDYDVTGFYIDMGKSDPKKKWGANQFPGALKPLKATLRFRTGGPATCHNPIRFVLRNKKTKEEIELEGNASLCTSPHEDAIIRLKVPQPKVIIEDGTPGAAVPPAGR